MIPPRLSAFAEAIGAQVADTRAGWTTTLELVGCWPIPAGSVSFGKGSSCVVGARLPISCAEVELTSRARDNGWTGGWMNGYNPSDRRIPLDWKQSIITEQEARRIIATEFPRAAFTKSGIPDLIFVRDGVVVAAECKRLRGKFRNNDCEWKTYGDTFRLNQEKWATDAIAAGISRDAILAIWWNRVDASSCE